MTFSEIMTQEEKFDQLVSRPSHERDSAREQFEIRHAIFQLPDAVSSRLSQRERMGLRVPVVAYEC